MAGPSAARASSRHFMSDRKPWAHLNMKVAGVTMRMVSPRLAIWLFQSSTPTYSAVSMPVAMAAVVVKPKSAARSRTGLPACEQEVGCRARRSVRG